MSKTTIASIPNHIIIIIISTLDLGRTDRQENERTRRVIVVWTRQNYIIGVYCLTIDGVSSAKAHTDRVFVECSINTTPDAIRLDHQRSLGIPPCWREITLLPTSEQGTMKKKIYF